MTEAVANHFSEAETISARAEKLAIDFLGGNMPDLRMKSEAFKLWGEFCRVQQGNLTNHGDDRHHVFALNKASRLLIEACRAGIQSRGECREGIHSILNACIFYRNAVRRSVENKRNGTA